MCIYLTAKYACGHPMKAEWVYCPRAKVNSRSAHSSGAADPSKLCGGVNGRYESPTQTSLVKCAKCIAEDKAERERRARWSEGRRFLGIGNGREWVG